MAREFPVPQSMTTLAVVTTLQAALKRKFPKALRLPSVQGESTSVSSGFLIFRGMTAQDAPVFDEGVSARVMPGALIRTPS